MFQQRLEKHYRLRDSKLAERGSASGPLENEKVIDLSEEYKFTYVLRWVCGEKKSFDERSAHSKAVLDDSLITVDTTAHHLIKGLAKKSHESHNIHGYFQFCGYFPTNDVILAFPTYSLLGLQIFTISELAAMKQLNNSLHLP